MASIVLVALLSNARQQDRTGPATEKRFPSLKVPPGFKATLFACDPLIEYPSVISIGPKPGAIFVAIDYMTGLGTDGKVKSEVRLVEDTDGDGYADKAVVVAKGFNSIQGLAYNDGTLFVMHAPFLTSVRGNERKDLLSGLGLTPEQNLVRLHCANGVTVGHDGWLYLSMGDNGVNVPRPEGDRLVHNGGCMLRCRPDGRDLHVFSTGLRNIYDIALDADLNVFTRDNENDGGTYMIRVCHSFFGADHGYPYDYYERPEHAMKPIGDFGLGSSAGGVCYLETQFPPEYRGNLFFCEWGKSLVRYPLQRAGSGFAPVKELQFAVGDSKDTYPFKPTDVVIQRDGTLMVADYADGQRPKRGRGRIYHIQHTGQDSDPVKKKPKSDLEKLNSESYFERCEAQAAFERRGRGDASQDILGNAFRADKIGPLGIGHALLVFSKGTEGTGLGDMQVMAHGGGRPAVRAQAIRIIGDLTDPILVKHRLDAGRGDVAIAKTLATLEDRGDPRIMLEIVIVLGRLRWADAPEWLTKNVIRPDDTLAHAAMQTLRRADNWPAVLKLLDQADNLSMRTIALRALSDRHEPVVVDGLIERLGTTKEDEHRRQYANLLTRVYKKPGPWKYWGYRPGPRPAHTEAWVKTDAIGKALDKTLGDNDRTVRAAVLKHMQREKVPVSTAALGGWLGSDFDAERVAVILASLADQPAQESRKYLQEAVLERKHSAANRLTALDLFLKKGDGGLWLELQSLAQEVEDGTVLADLIRRLGKHPKGAPAGMFANKLGSLDAEVRAAAIAALGETRARVKENELLKVLQDKDVRVRRAAAGAAGKILVKETIEPLLRLATESDLGVRLACLEALRLHKEPRVTPLALAALNEPTLELKALECLADFGGPELLKNVVEFAKRNPSSDGTAAAVRALHAWRERPMTTAIQQQDLDRAVAEIHGASGILVQWDVSMPYVQGGRDGIIKAMGVPPKRAKLWSPHFSAGAEGRLTLAPVKGAEQTLRYLFTDIDVPLATSVEFLASSRSTWEVFLNGKTLHRRAAPGKFQLDADRFPATLQQGMNRILIDAGSPNEAFEFHLRFRRKSSKAEHEALTQAALTRPGNAGRGSKIFFDKEKSQCIKCHQLGNQGERIGPELTGVGNRFSRIHIIESILEPSRTIAPSFGTFVFTLKSGKTINGVKIAETETSVTIADNQSQKHTFAKKDIDESSLSPLSSMPEGIEARLTADEFVDLIAFLTSQKEARPRE